MPVWLNESKSIKNTRKKHGFRQKSLKIGITNKAVAISKVFESLQTRCTHTLEYSN